MEKGGWIAVVVALITTAGVVASKYIEVGGKPATSTAVDGRGSGFVYTNIAQLNGSWHDQFGSRFLIAVTENRLTLSGSNGAKVMSGSGTADENTLKLAITNSFDFWYDPLRWTYWHRDPDRRNVHRPGRHGIRLEAIPLIACVPPRPYRSRQCASEV